MPTKIKKKVKRKITGINFNGEKDSFNVKMVDLM